MAFSLNTKRIVKCSKLVFIIISIFVFIFSLFDHTHFYGLNKKNDSKLNERIFNRLYFTVTTLSSANYGDIAPITTITKFITMILQIIIIVGVLIIFI